MLRESAGFRCDMPNQLVLAKRLHEAYMNREAEPVAEQVCVVCGATDMLIFCPLCMLPAHSSCVGLHSTPACFDAAKVASTLRGSAWVRAKPADHCSACRAFIEP